MKFKLDENLPTELLGELQAAGHEAQSVYDEGLVGAADPLILEKIKEESRIFLTMDKGIGDVRRYPPNEFEGIILFRPGASGRKAVFEFVRTRLPQILALKLRGRLLVVTDKRIRAR